MEWGGGIAIPQSYKHLVVIPRISQECFIIGQLKKEYGVLQ